MTTQPLIDRQLDQFTDKLIFRAGDIQRLEAAARALRAREVARLIGLAATWLKTFIVEPIASAIRAERAYRDLMALDDRMLADIGLSRSDIPAFIARSMVPRAEVKKIETPKAPVAQPKVERKLAA